MTPVSYGHGEIRGEIYLQLRAYARSEGGGAGVEVGCILARNPGVVRAPDVAYFRPERVPDSRGRAKFFSGAPDIAVEVALPD